MSPATAEALAREAISRGAAQKAAELTPLLELLQERRPRTVVEIGTAKGGTLFALCAVAHDEATIVSIDLPGGLFGGGYSTDDARRFEGFAGPSQRLVTLRVDSHRRRTRRRLERALAGRSIDFLLIDGDHTYEGVKRDWELYAPMVADGGLIALHDVLVHPGLPLCQVDRFWRQVAADHETREFLDPEEVDPTIGQWGGIGVVFKEGSVRTGYERPDDLPSERNFDWSVYPDTPIARLPSLLRPPALLARNLIFLAGGTKRN